MVLGQEQLATSLIDLSDGLSSDLNHVCADSNVGALIESALLPIDSMVVELCGRRALDPLQLALHGGEDYELLLTLRPGTPSDRLAELLGLTHVGTVIAESGVWLDRGGNRSRLEPMAWQHAL